MGESIRIHGDWTERRRVADSIVRCFSKHRVFANVNNSGLGIFRAKRSIDIALNRPYNEESLEIETCDCSTSSSSIRRERQYRPSFQHDSDCDLNTVYETLDNFWHEKQPLFVEVRKEEDAIEITLENSWAELAETRCLHDDGRPESQIAQKELWYAYKGLSAQFPSERTMTTSWLCDKGSVQFSINPDVDFDSGVPNELEVSISHNQPRKPMTVNLYNFFTVLSTPRAPCTFDLHSHPISDLSGFEAEHLEKYKIDYTTLSA